MEEFYGKLADILEVDEVKGSDVLEDFAEWDSLSVLSVIAMIDAQYGVNLTAADLKGIGSAQALYELVLSRNGKQ
jgi:acyl carrier protein